MRFYKSILLAAVFVGSIFPIANAGAGAKNKNALQVDADQLQTISKNTVIFTGNVIIKKGATEIRTNKAKISIWGKKKVTIYTDDIKATENIGR